MENAITLLESILDEVEGLRRTDARSYLPEPLLRRAREALTPFTAATGTGGAQLREVQDLVGATIAHVFDVGLKRGELVLVTLDGSFVAMTIDSTDDDASLHADRSSSGKLTDYVYPRELKDAGLLSESQSRELEREESERRVATARRRLAQAKETMDAAEKELARLLPAKAADGAPA